MKANGPCHEPHTIAELRAEVAVLRSALQKLSLRLEHQEVTAPVVAGELTTTADSTVVESRGPDAVLCVSNLAVSGTPAIPVRADTPTALQAMTIEGVAVEADSSFGCAVHAHTTSGPAAVLADHRSADAQGTAVIAQGGSGIGVHASGARAALRLSPSNTSPGPPTEGRHSAGELVFDGTDLYLCKSGGSPGIWARIG